MLDDETLEDSQRIQLEFNALLMGAFFNQAYGGHYLLDTNGMQTFHRKRQTPKMKDKYKADVKRYPNHIRNEVTVRLFSLIRSTLPNPHRLGTGSSSSIFLAFLKTMKLDICKQSIKKPWRIGRKTVRTSKVRLSKRRV